MEIPVLVWGLPYSLAGTDGCANQTIQRNLSVGSRGYQLLGPSLHLGGFVLKKSFHLHFKHHLALASWLNFEIVYEGRQAYSTTVKEMKN